MRVSGRQGNSAAWGAGDKSKLDEKWFVNVFNCFGLLANPDRKS
jgi:hypothetical protein